MPEVSEARPASTVVLLRDTPAGMETLLLKRNQALMFAGGFWVFPGGSIDEQELAACNGDMEAAARLTAAREAEEECGLKPRLNEMVQLSQWTTPEAEPRRFKTWFYAAPLHSDDKSLSTVARFMMRFGFVFRMRWTSMRRESWAFCHQPI